jgi:hypothetical protein
LHKPAAHHFIPIRETVFGTRYRTSGSFAAEVVRLEFNQVKRFTGNLS